MDANIDRREVWQTMAGQRQPTDLVVMKGKKHLSKAEIAARKDAEVVAPNDKVRPPAY